MNSIEDIMNMIATDVVEEYIEDNYHRKTSELPPIDFRYEVIELPSGSYREFED